MSVNDNDKTPGNTLSNEETNQPNGGNAGASLVVRCDANNQLLFVV